MKTQTLASFVWNSWKGKPASVRFVPNHRKTASPGGTLASTKKSEPEAPKSKRPIAKLSKADCRELISKTQHLDPCFATLWRRST